MARSSFRRLHSQSSFLGRYLRLRLWEFIYRLSSRSTDEDRIQAQATAQRLQAARQPRQTTRQKQVARSRVAGRSRTPEKIP